MWFVIQDTILWNWVKSTDIYWNFALCYISLKIMILQTSAMFLATSFCWKWQKWLIKYIRTSDQQSCKLDWHRNRVWITILFSTWYSLHKGSEEVFSLLERTPDGIIPHSIALEPTNYLIKQFLMELPESNLPHAQRLVNIACNSYMF
jgi:hypothetical protein